MHRGLHEISPSNVIHIATNVKLNSSSSFTGSITIDGV